MCSLRTLFAAAFLAIIACAPATADPVPYRLDAERSLVGFSFDLAGNATQGTMAVAEANIALDLDNLPRSRVSVVLDARAATTELGFATQAMRGPQVLDTARFPRITFRASRISGTLNGGTVMGDVTVRGVTRPVTLAAQVFRQRGTEEGDRSKLSVLLTGTIDRRDFGADGFPQFVGSEVRLEILTRLTRK